MADDRTMRSAASRAWINMQKDYEVRYWTKKWSVRATSSVRQGRGGHHGSQEWQGT
jgi:hypothetical protein